jgi:hypothetical protein
MKRFTCPKCKTQYQEEPAECSICDWSVGEDGPMQTPRNLFEYRVTYRWNATPGHVSSMTGFADDLEEAKRRTIEILEGLDKSVQAVGVQITSAEYMADWRARHKGATT